MTWLVVSLIRLLQKGIFVHRQISRYQMIVGDLRQELNQISYCRSTIRLLRSNSNDRETPIDLLGAQRRSSQIDGAQHDADNSTRNSSRKVNNGPFACGVWRWTIVLPEGIERCLSRQELRALLAHEVAHLVRRDPVWQWVGEFLCTCLAFQPLNFLARRRFRQATELLCDDSAIARHVPVTVLASCLAKIAEWKLDQQPVTMGLLAVGNRGNLTRRIEWLLRTGRASEPRRSMTRSFALYVALCAGLMVGVYGPRLTFQAPLVSANDRSDNIILNEIDLELAATMDELALIESELISDTDPEIVELVRRLHHRTASLRERNAHLR